MTHKYYLAGLDASEVGHAFGQLGGILLEVGGSPAGVRRGEVDLS